MATADDLDDLDNDDTPDLPVAPQARSWRAVGDVAAAVGLGLALAVVLAVDPRTKAPPILRAGQTTSDRTDQPPPPPPPPPPRPIDPLPRVQFATLPTGRFGLKCLSGNPDDPSDDGKRLTFNPQGDSSNIRVMVDNIAPLFGEPPGTLVEPLAEQPDGSRTMTWSYRDVTVTQVVRLEAGDLSRRIDTLHVTYILKNADTAPHTAGLRVMLDMLIGDNDGVPFIVPGRPGIVTGPLELAGEEVPDFVRSLERPVLERPGVIVDIGLVPAEGEERPSELVLSHWPGRDAEWLYDRHAPFGDDTALGLYYRPRPLAPGATRKLGFTYGLGTISSTATKNARLSLTAGGPIRSGASFWLVALVTEARRGQTVCLTLPDGLSARQPAELTQPVAPTGGYTQLSWLVAVSPTLAGEVAVSAALEPGAVTERQTLTIRPPDAALSLVPHGPFRAGRPFWVSALVRHGRPGQRLELDLPAGLSLAEGHARTQPVGAAVSGDYAQVNWLIVADPRASGGRDLSVHLRPAETEARATVDIAAADLTH